MLPPLPQQVEFLSLRNRVQVDHFSSLPSSSTKSDIRVGRVSSHIYGREQSVPSLTNIPHLLVDNISPSH
jgi:hypothetical protein